MKIKYNNFLIITPLFFTIALAMSYLNYIDEVREIKWGIESKAKSIAIPSSIFIEYMLKAEDLSKVLEEVKPKFENILHYNQAQRFYISQGKHILLDTAPEKSSNELIIPDNLKDTIVSEMYTKNNRQQITIHTPIEGASVNTVLSVEVDNTAFFKQIDEAFYEMIYSIIFISILGLITSYILSRIVTGKIYALNKDAHAIATGNYSHNSYIGNIREFTDLGDTLNIMKSIMKEIIFKAKNIIIKEDKFRSDEELLNTYNKAFSSSKKVSIGEIELAINSIGYPEIGYFFDCFVFSGKIYAYMAKAEIRDSSLETILITDAAQRYILYKVQKQSFDILQVKQIFKLDYFEFISIDENALLHASKTVNGKILESNIKMKDDIVHLICNENSPIERELRIYIENYQELSIGELSADILKLFPSRTSELFVMVQKSKSHKEKL